LNDVAGSIFNALDSVSAAPSMFWGGIKDVLQGNNLDSSSDDSGYATSEEENEEDEDEAEEDEDNRSSDDDSDVDSDYTDSENSSEESDDPYSVTSKHAKDSYLNGSASDDSEDDVVSSYELQGITISGKYHTYNAKQSQIWLHRGVLACRLGLYDKACMALDACNSREFSLHGWMAKVQVLTMMCQLGEDMKEIDDMGNPLGKNRTFTMMEETMEALCRVMLFVQEFNTKYDIIHTEDDGRTGSGGSGHQDESDSYLRKTFYTLVGQYGLVMIKRGIERIRHRSRKGLGEFLDGKKLELPNLIHELVETSERLKVQGSDR